MRNVVIPAVRSHVPRCQEIALVVSAASAPSVWPLFAIPAPRLKNLQVIVRRANTTLAPLPMSMFSGPEPPKLEHVFLYDVPLPCDIPPVRHELLGVKFIYVHLPSQLDDALHWIPQAHSVDLWAGPLDDDEPDPLSPSLFQSHPNLQHASVLAIYNDLMLRSSPCRRIPVLHVRMRYPDSMSIRDLLADETALCMCIRTELRPQLGGGKRPWGIVTIATPDRRVVRHLDFLSASYMKSRHFLRGLVDGDKVVHLTIGISAGLVRLCRLGCQLPRLRTLCLLIKRLPTDTIRWTSGSIVCLGLRTLLLQRDESLTELTIRRAAVDRFIIDALQLREGASLDVFLSGVRMLGDDNKSGTIASVSYRDKGPQPQPGGKWRTIGREINNITWVVDEPWMGWMDA
ncbi:hypothetical protein AURDEDRAFT_178694 [Auricularia subglabra TFB-10046 SS5]|uniref:Uncharacterized protein n=1 Tax=Auricularia subglabra (strain TFB-10046 / SS5) TaxID=717982 RepID=J0D119_AURST|nr:hypothetical protein AURDEDRAFT_178694 [Auricularia subglabra TFB-10046 SS5]